MLALETGDVRIVETTRKFQFRGVGPALWSTEYRALCRQELANAERGKGWSSIWLSWSYWSR